MSEQFGCIDRHSHQGLAKSAETAIQNGYVCLANGYGCSRAICHMCSRGFRPFFYLCVCKGCISCGGTGGSGRRSAYAWSSLMEGSTSWPVDAVHLLAAGDVAPLAPHHGSSSSSPAKLLLMRNVHSCEGSVGDSGARCLRFSGLLGLCGAPALLARFIDALIASHLVEKPACTLPILSYQRLISYCRTQAET